MAVPRQYDFPTELIGEIASYMGQEAMDSRVKDNGIAPYTWNSAGLVCRKWAAAIFNNATLWTEVMITSADALKNVLARSLRCPLTIRGSLVGEEGRSAKTELDAHDERMWYEDKFAYSAQGWESLGLRLDLGQEERKRIIERARASDLRKWTLIRRELPRISKIQLTMSSLMHRAHR
ncbi:hypothetical protein NEOLEDRAFT_1136715 [Neolentinus lepideus HHB14362 ss-1]|uniref:Uncharacterized protein n=1 Tax=Neolentinus lepideus HHB14362 ss-1 TaxID=1314782 RepID=A0A165R5S3_9AGAM|nr:hypothetical protein NEOLEDRAFT_1136715 [Neolentinus lepideus HHB14362 ss-1]